MGIRHQTLLSAAIGVLMSFGAIGLAAAEQKPYQIALSNSYIGNQWRIESINLAKAYAARALKGRVVLSVTSSGVEVQRQIAVMNDMIARRVDAILVNPASEHGLDAVIAQATARNIPVIAFDHPVSSPDAYRVHVDFAKFGELQAQWLADELHGKGDIIVNRGVAGIGGDKEIYDGSMAVLKKYPGIHVVAEVFGKWDDSVSESEVTKALIAHPKVDGVLNQYGSYGALQAFLNLHRPLVPMSGDDSNGWRVALLKYKDQGLRGISVGDPPSLGAYALKVAVDILDKKKVARDIVVPIPVMTSDTAKVGVNVFPDLPAGTYPGIDIPGADLGLTMNDAMGK
ncbi:MAG TPA: sugar ABC transporter substrate-binding protein [Roseiarcus sp.]|nr:sugar ABC transporter substrate-binding protein [Roseiarcus sp.]